MYINLDHSNDKSPKKNNKSKKIKFKFSKFVKITLTVYGIIILSVSGFLYVHYHQTQSWSSGELNGKLNNIPPEFTKNTYPVGMVSSINQLSDVENILSKIDINHGLNNDLLKEAEIAYNKSTQILNKYHVHGGQSYQNQQNLKLDIDEYKFQKHAYQNPEPKQLNHLLGSLISRNLQNTSVTDEHMINNLKHINNDYKTLNDFLKSSLTQIGTFNHQTFMVKHNVNISMTKSLIKTINDLNLSKFPNINKLLILLNQKQWQTVMANNQAYFEREKWQQVEKQFLNLHPNQYINTNDLQTLKDAQHYNLIIDHSNLDKNAQLSLDSAIDQIIVDGQKVDDGVYIKKDANIKIILEPVYKSSHTHNDNKSKDDKYNNDNKSKDDKSNDNKSNDDKSNDDKSNDDTSNDNKSNKDKSNDDTSNDDKSNDDTSKDDKSNDDTSNIDNSNDDTSNHESVSGSNTIDDNNN